MAARSVEIRLESKNDEQEVLQCHDGDLYIKGDSIYYRYREPDMGKVTTTVKIKGEQIKVFRHGDIESEQTFTLDREEWGFYQTPQLKIDLQTKTTDVLIDLQQGLGTISWSYELFTAGDSIGKHQLMLTIVEGTN